MKDEEEDGETRGRGDGAVRKGGALVVAIASRVNSPLAAFPTAPSPRLPVPASPRPRVSPSPRLPVFFILHPSSFILKLGYNPLCAATY
jgi:hypothetical protein